MSRRRHAVSARPPRLAEALLARMFGAADREFALGDMAQEYVELRVARGWLVARGWYWWMVLLFLSGGGRRIGRAETEPGRRFGDLSTNRQPRTLIDGGGPGRNRWAPRIDALRSTFALALRGLRRSPGFTLGVVVTLALGIGVNAAMFDIVDRLLLSPPQHIRDADAVKRLYRRTVDPVGGAGCLQRKRMGKQPHLVLVAGGGPAGR